MKFRIGPNRVKTVSLSDLPIGSTFILHEHYSSELHFVDSISMKILPPNPGTGHKLIALDLSTGKSTCCPSTKEVIPVELYEVTVRM